MTNRSAAAQRIRNATFAVVDVETTGFDAAADRVVEVACIVVRGGVEIERFSSLVNPGRPIPAIASAVHHITNRHVESAPSLEELRPRLSAMCADAVVVAHNASFDLRFLPFLAHRPVLCTMRFAQRTIPDAPNFKNQVLRYHLAIDDFAGPIAAHRALGDVEVTSRILGICLERYMAATGRDDAYDLVREVAAPRRLRATVASELERRHALAS